MTRLATGSASQAGGIEVSRFVALASPDLPSPDPLSWPDYPAKLQAAERRAGTPQAVTVGLAEVGGESCVLITFNFGFLGGSMGQEEGALIVHAIDEARRTRRPLVSVARSGGARMQEGTVALVQMPRIAAALAQLAAAGVPHISVADDPTTGGVWASLVANADIIIGRSGAQVAFAGSRVLPGNVREQSSSTVEGKYAAGFLDVVADETAVTAVVADYLRLLSPASRGEPTAPPLPTLRPGQPEEALAGWASVGAARAPHRRRASDYLESYLREMRPVWGDRVGGTERQVLCGFGRREGRTIGFVCQQGGPVGPAGFRTATRLFRLAQCLQIPVVTFIDTAGADNTPAAERHGIGTSIAAQLRQLAETTVPVLSVVVGQGISGGAVALINPNSLWMAPDSYLAVIAPESAAAILKQDPSSAGEVAERLALSPRDLVQLNVAQGVLTP